MKLPRLTREVVPARSSTWTYWLPCSLLVGLAIVATLGLSLQSLAYPESPNTDARVQESPISHIHSTLSDALISSQSMQREVALAAQFSEIYLGGSLQGVQVKGLPADSVLMALGIRNGDIIEAAYDSELGTRGYRAMTGDFIGTLLSRLSAGPTIEIDRSGRRIHIHLMPSS